MKSMHLIGLVGFFAVATACSPDAPPGTETNDELRADSGESDDEGCGSKLVGVTCQKPGGGCEALICVGSDWTCPDGDLRAPLTPKTCTVPEPSTPDAGSCGERKIGGTCKKPGGGCEAEICVGSDWTCPDGDTPVALTPYACQIPDGG